MPKSKIYRLLNLCIFEIRYEPIPNILDQRGKIAGEVSKFMNLSKWKINTNRVDVFSDDLKTLAFQKVYEVDPWSLRSKLPGSFGGCQNYNVSVKNVAMR